MSEKKNFELMKNIYKKKHVLYLYYLFDVSWVVCNGSTRHYDRQLTALLQGVRQGQEGEKDICLVWGILTKLEYNTR